MYIALLLVFSFPWRNKKYWRHFWELKLLLAISLYSLIKLCWATTTPLCHSGINTINNQQGEFSFAHVKLIWAMPAGFLLLPVNFLAFPLHYRIIIKKNKTTEKTLLNFTHKLGCESSTVSQPGPPKSRG